MELDNIYNMDCLEGMKQIPDGSIDAVICDLPYGTMKGAALKGWDDSTTAWDDIIPTDKLFEQYERVLRRSGVAILFSQEPYTNHLRGFKAQNIDFCYPLMWKKDCFGNNLMANVAPVSFFEDISVFSKRHDSECIHPLRPYFAKVMEYIGKPRKQVIETIGQNADHTFRCNSSQFALCTAETYRQLIDVYGIDKMEGYRTYEDLKQVDSMKFARTFNLPEGKAYLSNVLEFSKDTDGFHPTQKPVALIQRLVETYTNEGDTVLDNCMGSGTTAIACHRAKRHFIGFELNKEYYDKACKRIDLEQRQLTLF